MPKVVRVVVEISPRQVSLSLTDEAGGRVEYDRFGVEQGYPDIAQVAVGRDVYNLLYQCASDALLGGESDGTRRGK